MSAIWSGSLEDNAEWGSSFMERKPGGQRRVWVCFIWSRNLEDNAECGSAIWSGNLEDNAECGSAVYGAETWRTTQKVGLLDMSQDAWKLRFF